MTRVLAAALALWAFLFHASQAAQPQDAAPSRPTTLGQAFAAADNLDPPRRLGVKAHVLREAQQVARTVVLADSPADAARAIAAWRGFARFPVLIDDGSARALEDIARFVRAFEPERVARWRPDPAAPGSSLPPDDPDQRFGWILASLGSSFGATTPPANPRDLVQTATASGVRPFGVVALDPAHDAWVAGLALAAGRVQPVIRVAAPGGRPRSVGAVMNGDEAIRLDREITSALTQSGLSWRALGDDLDAVTIAANTPSRVRGIGDRGPLALTDLIGRHGLGLSGAGERWAWCGLVFGDAPRSLYAAMCALFLPTERAWLFDGYKDEPPFDQWDATKAASVLAEAGLQIDLFDDEQADLSGWRSAVSGGVSAGLLLVNSKGRAHQFVMRGGWGHPGDMPLLREPAVVHMVHSFSLQEPGRVSTVGGRLVEHGAYAYVGSMDEPTLNAFVPTPIFAARLLALYPLAAAGRIDNAPAWKLNVLGDPLITLKAGDRVGRESPVGVTLAGLHDLEEGMKSALREGDYTQGVRDLVLLGRDQDAARLAAKLLDEQAPGVTSELASAACLAAFRSGQRRLVAELFVLLDEHDQARADNLDALWHAGHAVLGAGERDDRARFAELMERHPRESQTAEDFILLARLVRSGEGGAEAAAGVLRRAIGRLEQAPARDRVRKELSKYGG